MGRSSVYNRLALDGTHYLEPIGYTVGWGHFHITDQLFSELRDYLRVIEHPYADQHKFGQGPNWRLRTIRAALGVIGINESVLRHGVQREVFISTLARNSLNILKTGKGRPNLAGLQTVAEISDLARDRWLVPRAERRPEFTTWKRAGIESLIRTTPASDAMEMVSKVNAR
jgi:hypothetical protein